MANKNNDLTLFYFIHNTEWNEPGLPDIFQVIKTIYENILE